MQFFLENETGALIWFIFPNSASLFHIYRVHIACLAVSRDLMALIVENISLFYSRFQIQVFKTNLPAKKKEFRATLYKRISDE
jgi:hypothetical protein